MNSYNNKLISRSKITLKVSTWLRDSHELFDYESINLKKEVIELEDSRKYTFRINLIRLLDGILRSENHEVTTVVEIDYF